MNKALIAGGLVFLILLSGCLLALEALGIAIPATGDCRGLGKIGYDSHEADIANEEFKITLINGTDKDIESSTLYLDLDRDGDYDKQTASTEIWPQNQKKTFTIKTPFDFKSGDRYNVEVTVEFTPKGRLTQSETAICFDTAK